MHMQDSYEMQYPELPITWTKGRSLWYFLVRARGVITALTHSQRNVAYEKGKHNIPVCTPRYPTI